MIHTNNQPRRIIGWEELTSKEQLLLGTSYVREDYVRYRGATYPLSLFKMTDDTQLYLKGWDLFLANSLFYGVVARFDQKSPGLIMGYYRTLEAYNDREN